MIRDFLFAFFSKVSIDNAIERMCPYHQLEDPILEIHHFES